MERFKALIIFLSFIGFSAVNSEPKSSEYFPGSVSLVDNDVYHLFWNVDGDSITLEVHAKTRGWVGFGLSPNGGMAHSDIVIGWVADGNAYLKDYHGIGNERPILDARQDWKLLRGEETPTHTILKFKRALLACDSDDRDITPNTVRTIFAYSDTDPTSGEDVAYHGSWRGTKSIALMAKKGNVEPLPADAFYIDYRGQNATILDTDTTYWCEGYFPPKFTQKHHMIKVEPLIEKGHEAFVHHMIIYACYHIPDGLNATGPGPNGMICHSRNMPWDYCSVIIAAWGIGSSSFNWPSHVGFPFGESGGISYLKLETHYDNPQLKKGIVDNSGLRLWFTPTLRQHDSGMLVMGLLVSSISQILPSGYQSLTFNGHCTEECIREGLGDHEEIKIFGNVLHTHLLGIGLKLHHYRNGIELPPIDYDMTFDFNFQDTRSIYPEVTLKKGDNIVLECIYNTEKKDVATFGGLGTPQEMCLSFISYYPRVDLSGCSSGATQENIAKKMGYTNYEIFYGSPDKIFYGEMIRFTDGPWLNMTFNQYIEKAKVLPDDASKVKYQEALLTGEMRQHCNAGVKNLRWEKMPVPEVLSPYEAIGLCSSGRIPRATFLGFIVWLLLIISNVL